MIFFKYVFYRIYSVYHKKCDKKESAFTAMIFVSLFLFMNIFVIGAVLNKINLLHTFFNSEFQVIVFMTSLFVINFFVFVVKNRYEKICYEFDQKADSKSKQNGWLIVIYFIFSISLLFVVPFIKP